MLKKMKTSDIDKEKIIELIEDNKWIKYTVYAGCTIIGIWVLGKATKLLSDAIFNFKTLHNAIKS
jgi:hypothetical protein